MNLSSFAIIVFTMNSVNLVSCQNPQQRHVILFSNRTFATSDFYMMTTLDEPNLQDFYPSLQWDPSPVKLICYLGSFVAYENREYEGSWSYGEWINQSYCLNIHRDNSNSLRFVGMENNTIPAITTFSSTHFHGILKIYSEDVPNLNDAFSSIMVTGSIPWTLYQTTNYGGVGICAREKWQWYVTDISTTFGIQHGSVKSMRKGCDASQNYILADETPKVNLPVISNNSNKRHIIFYNNVTESLSTFYMMTERDEANLLLYPPLHLRNRPGKLVCHLGGFIIYEDPNFGEGTTFWAHVPWTNTIKCEIRHLNILSVRFLGFKDVNFPSLNLFERVHFRGSMTAYAEGVQNTQIQSGGIYITGESWRIYELPNFGGRAICLNPTAYPDITVFGLPQGIQSFKRGC